MRHIKMNFRTIEKRSFPMKILSPILFTLLLATVVLAQQQIVPIVELSVGGIIGGVANGKWVKDKQVAATLKGQEEYLLVGWKGIEEGGVTLGSKPVAEVPCDEF